jgi:hypothetical protein
MENRKHFGKMIKKRPEILEIQAVFCFARIQKAALAPGKPSRRHVANKPLRSDEKIPQTR